MSAKAHPRLVGAFVLGAIALVVGAVLFFSGADWLQPRDRFSVYFPGSVRGLNPGAPVTFRGIKIGEVSEVKAVLTGKPDPLIQIEVVLEFVGDIVETPPGIKRPFTDLSGAELGKALIERGIRGKLQSQSLLTGQKYVDFDFKPDEEARLSGLNPRHPELPTTPTAMEKMGDKFELFFNKLAELPLDQMLEDVRRVIQSLREVVSSPDLKAAITGARRTTQALEPTLQEARAAMMETRGLIQRLDGQLKELGGDAGAALRELRDSLQRAQRTLDSLDHTIAGADETRLSAAETLDELARAMRAIRNLVDYIQTHPEAVVQGKPQTKEKK